MGLKGYWGGVRIPISLRAPRGKLIQIGAEEVEVWPAHCVNGHHCIQCYFNGKIRCAPRWWYYPSVYLAPLPTKETSYFEPELSLDLPVGKYGGTLADLIPAQPLIPLNDGGFTEEITNDVMSRRTFKRPSLYRDTDQPCLKCDYPYLHYVGFKKSKKKNLYRCPQCGRGQYQDSRAKPEKIKPFLRELEMQGFRRKDIITLIQRRYGVKISKGWLRQTVRDMGIAPRKSCGNKVRLDESIARLGIVVNPA